MGRGVNSARGVLSSGLSNVVTAAAALLLVGESQLVWLFLIRLFVVILVSAARNQNALH